MLQIMVRLSILFFLATVLGSSAPSHAQTLSEILDKMDPQGSEHDRLVREFESSDPSSKRHLLEYRREALEYAKQRGIELESWVRANQERIAAKTEELEQKASAFGEMLGQFRYVAGRAGRKLELSLARFEHPERTGELKHVAEARTLPTRADLDVLPNAILNEMRAQSEVKLVRLSDVLNASTDGSFSERELIRIGTFFMATVDTGEYVNGQKFSFLPGSPYRLVIFAGEPVPGFYADMKALSDAEPAEVVRVPIDYKHGALFNKEIFSLVKKR